MMHFAMQTAFWSLAALTIIPALCVVNARSIVHAGFWLLPCFLGVAGLYAALEAHFFFVTQIMIYAGAILVLVLFALMLTRNAMDPGAPQHNRLRPAAGVICAAFGILASYTLSHHHWNLSTALPGDAQTQTQALGDALIGLYAVPFEVASLLLLSALIGAVVLAKADRGPTADTPALADLMSPSQPAQSDHERIGGH